VSKRAVIAVVVLIVLASVALVYVNKEALFGGKAYEKTHTWVMTVQTNQPPVADFDYTIDGLTIYYTDESYDPDGSIVSWLWYLGDGTTATEQNPIHTYPSGMAGNPISVSLTVTDNEGEQNTKVEYITLPSPQTYTLTVTVSPTGYGTVNPSSGTYNEGEQVTITATPSEGYAFSQWGGDATGNQNPITITMDSDKNIVAYFEALPPNQYTLTANADPPEGGTITLNPSGGVYNAGTVVTVMAIPNDDYSFAYWSGDITGNDATVHIAMDENKQITAHFEYQPVQYTLVVNTFGDGIVTLSPSGGTYSKGTEVTLTAQPNTGYVFDRWEGDLTGSQNPATITMDGNKVVNAYFSEIQPYEYTLTVNANPDNGGVVIISPSGGSYIAGTTVTITATPNNGFTFDHWGGDVSGDSSTITITMDGDKTVTAYFEKTRASMWWIALIAIGAIVSAGIGVWKYKK